MSGLMDRLRGHAKVTRYNKPFMTKMALNMTETKEKLLPWWFPDKSKKRRARYITQEFIRHEKKLLDFFCSSCFLNNYLREDILPDGSSFFATYETTVAKDSYEIPTFSEYSRDDSSSQSNPELFENAQHISRLVNEKIKEYGLNSTTLRLLSQYPNSELFVRIIVYGHGGGSGNPDEPSKMTCIQLYNMQLLKYVVFAQGTVGLIKDKLEGDALFMAISGIVDHLDNFKCSSPDLTPHQLADEINRLLSQEQYIEAFGRKQLALLKNYFMNPQYRYDSTWFNQDTDFGNDGSKLKMCQNLTVDKTYNPKVHLINKIYGLQDHNPAKENSYIKGKFSIRTPDGSIYELCQEIFLAFNYEGFNAMDSSDKFQYSQIQTSDILIAFVGGIHEELKQSGLNRDILISLLNNTLVVDIDISCNAESSFVCPSDKMGHGGNKKTKKMFIEIIN